ncbi:FixH family protein [Xinfangfangia sp. D13-10-4-6]|uniref:FixH family protein n=1 Tax=Pseudogemmobacter hezensis TaxID=2737662 RepID=UPI0015528FEC|nr:FixH family protein [Pseudogemmobacter hezensis]NPD14388.1 FixH family protein [Pseudogemmobacter hezensis]
MNGFTAALAGREFLLFVPLVFLVVGLGLWLGRRRLTGGRVLFAVLSFFGIVTAVNVFMAYKAVSTFPGLEVQSSYVAGRGFDGRRDAQEALGWQLEQTYSPGTMALRITDASGTPVEAKAIEALIGRVTIARDDQTPEFIWQGDRYEAAVELGSGEWMMKVQAIAQDGTPFERRLDFVVAPRG